MLNLAKPNFDILKFKMMNSLGIRAFSKVRLGCRAAIWAAGLKGLQAELEELQDELERLHLAGRTGLSTAGDVTWVGNGEINQHLVGNFEFRQHFQQFT